MAENIIVSIILCLTALVMTGIGVWQLKSRKPVGFYTGVKPPEEKRLRDVKTWNRKHGIMWIVYGGAITGCGLMHIIAGILGYEGVILMLTEFGVLIGGMFFMMWYHARLERVYRV